MKQPTVLLDVDGVLAMFTAGALDAIHIATGQRFAVEDVTEWDVMRSLNIDAETAARLYETMRVEGFCANLGVYPGAQEGVARLRTLADVHVVTAPFGGRWWQREREVWLERHFDFAASDITFTHQKHRIDGDYLIDDRVATLQAWSDVHPRGVPVKWSRPTNQHDRLDSCVSWTLSDWDELCDRLQDFHPQGE